jgi:tetratricopeptide (TPR) repeat protein
MKFRALLAALAWPLALAAQPAGEVERPAIPPGVLDPQLPPRPLEAAVRELEQHREAAPTLDRYAAGDYAAAARLGEDVLQRAPDLHAVRFAVANSLAWTGRYDAAAAHYRALLGTPYDTQARLGIANALRWRGQPELAEPQYLALLARDPASEEARKGLALTARELRPALTLRFVPTADNQDMRRQELAAAYRRWSADRAWRIEAGVLGERNQGPTRDWSASGLNLSAWAMRLPFTPKIDLSVYDSELHGAQYFASLQLEPMPDRLRVRLARVNWARLAFTEAAAVDGLTAHAVGAYGEAQLPGGALRGRLEAYDISDGNSIADAELQITPAWQPLPSRLGLVWFGGLYGRYAEREDPRYWSPRPLYGLAFLGLQRNWGLERTDVTASARRGFPFTDSARNSWSAGVNARHWIRGDVAVGLDAWVAESPRPADYRVHQVAAYVQHLW